MKTLPSISNAEFEVMGIIWKYAPIHTNDIVEKLSEEKNWNPKTIQTMLFRLEKKGVITHEKDGRTFVYTPLIEKNAYMEAEGKVFLHRFFDGAIRQMVASFIDETDLSPHDIDDLRQILDKKCQK